MRTAEPAPPPPAVLLFSPFFWQHARPLTLLYLARRVPHDYRRTWFWLVVFAHACAQARLDAETMRA